MSTLQAFVDEVFRKLNVKTIRHSDTFLIDKEQAVEAALFIDKRLKAAAAGGKSRQASRVVSDDPRAVAARRRTQKWREKQKKKRPHLK